MTRWQWSVGLAMAGAVVCSCGDDSGQAATLPDDGHAMVGDQGFADAGVATPPANDAATAPDADTRDAATTSDAALNGGDAAEDAGRPVDASVRDARVVDAAPIVAGKPSWLIQPGDSVFFIGNSFFTAYDRVLPKWVEAVGQAVQPSFAIETDSYLVPGVLPLQWFFDQSESQDAIASGRWDMFVIQGEDDEPVYHKQDFFNAVRAYHQAITAKGAKMMLFMTWDLSEDGPDSDFYAKLSSAYNEIGSELNVPVIPVGDIYNDCNKDLYPGQTRYFLNRNSATDHLHQSVYGSAVNAYATFSMLTGINPMGVQFVARGNTNTADFLRYASDKSWARAAERLHD